MTRWSTPGTVTRRPSAPSAMACSPAPPNSVSDARTRRRGCGQALRRGVTPTSFRSCSVCRDDTSRGPSCWLGTHANGPTLLDSGSPLADLTGELPYLLKVLCRSRAALAPGCTPPSSRPRPASQPASSAILTTNPNCSWPSPTSTRCAAFVPTHRPSISCARWASTGSPTPSRNTGPVALEMLVSRRPRPRRSDCRHRTGIEPGGPTGPATQRPVRRSTTRASRRRCSSTASRFDPAKHST